MRNVIVVMQTTLDGRISNADGQFWEPFAWGASVAGPRLLSTHLAAVYDALLMSRSTRGRGGE